MKLTVALAQIPVTDDIGVNLKTILESIDFAARNKADILLTPEGSLSGYTHEFDSDALDRALAAVEAAAAGAGVGLALGTCKYEADARCYNELRFYLPDGTYLGCHTKTLLCGTPDEPVVGEINHFSTMPLRVFDFNGITIGGLICNDMWANPTCTPMADPHLSHQLSRMGAKIIFQAVNGGRDASEKSQVLVKRFHECHVLMKAEADQVYIATADNSYPETIPVSSIGGVASPDAVWVYKLNETGRQLGVYTIELDN
ncbi:MAG: carbon-nitrogen hydrolase family protein [Hominenteromicrobium sp.]